MRKRLITPTPEVIRSHGEGWLDIGRAAVVEFTSEDKDYPVESAFGSGSAGGWRKAVPGAQTIRLVFDQPQRIRRISLVFDENETSRTQEFLLQWSSDGGRSYREIVRQQWNFSPPETMREAEEYKVDLSSVTVLELVIHPNVSGGSARAWLKSFRLSRRQHCFRPTLVVSVALLPNGCSCENCPVNPGTFSIFPSEYNPPGTME